jgi:hypothetical protein
MNEDKFIRHTAEAVDRWTDKELSSPPSFGGKPGTPVPEVDPDDLRTVWEYGEKIKKECGPNGAVEIGIFERLCKPGVDLQAVCYRAQNLALAFMLAQEQLDRFSKEKLIGAAARVPMEWMGAGIVRQGPPYDFNEFLRLCAAD